MPEKKEGDKSTVKTISRRALLARYGIDSPDMPHCDAEFIIAYLFEIGPTVPAGMGEAPLPWSEIESWQRCNGITLEPWVCRFIRKLSIEFINESQRATAHDCRAPWESEQYEQAARSEQIRRSRDALRAMAG